MNTPKASKMTGRFVEMIVNRAYKQGLRCEWSEFKRAFIINGAVYTPKQALKRTA